MNEEPKPMECSKCHREGLTTDDFSKHRSHKNGYYSQCKQCLGESNKAWYVQSTKKQIEKVTVNRRARLYGLTKAEQEMLFLRQGGKCLICRSELLGRNKHLDHSHAKKKARAFLCSGCNTAIGLLKEDPKRIRRAAAYVQAFQSNHPDPHQLLLNLRSIGAF